MSASGEPLDGIHVVLASSWLPRQLVEDQTEILAGVAAKFEVEFPHVESAMTTDASGRFRLRYHEGGDRTLYAQRRDGTVAAILREPSDGEPCVVTVTDDPQTLEVHVTRETDGRAVPGAVVKVTQTDVDLAGGGWCSLLATPRGPHSAESTTGDDGRCRLTDLVQGPARVEVFAPGLAPRLGEHVLVPCAEVDVRLSQGFALTGHVLDAESGAAIGGAQVLATPERVVDGTVATTDAAGLFRIENVPASEARSFSTVSARAPGYAAEELQAGFIDETRTCDVTFAMHRAARVRVRCIGADGAPLADAIADVLSGHMGPRQKFGDVTPPWFSFEDEKSTDTDAEGRAIIDGLHPGGDGIEMMVRFYLDGIPVLERTYPPLAAGETRDLGEVVLALGTTLRGTLLDADGHPVGGAKVAAAPTDPADNDHTALGRAIVGDGGRLAESAADGSFTLVGLAPGLWDLYAAPDFGAPGTIERGVDPHRAGITLRLPRLVTLAGRVVDAHGDGVPRACVSVTSKDFFGMVLQNQVLCDEHGRFELARFVEGTGELEVEVAGKDIALQSFRARPGASGVELRLR